MHLRLCSFLFTMQKLLLLDFDGVVLRSPRSMKLVSNRAARYVKSHVTQLSNKESSIVNKYLYKTFGHTVTGLNKMGYNAATMEDYNSFVYKNIDYRTLADEADIFGTYSLLAECDRNGIDVAIFTNSPRCWHENILSRMPLPYEVDAINMCGLLKPDQRVYKDIEKRYPYHKIFFVDDSFVNFSTYTLMNEKWVNIMFDTQKIEMPKHINLKVVNNLSMVSKIITSQST